MEVLEKYIINTIKLIRLIRDLIVKKNHLPLLNRIPIITLKEEIDLISIYILKLILDYVEISFLHNKIDL